MQEPEAAPRAEAGLLTQEFEASEAFLQRNQLYIALSVAAVAQQPSSSYERGLIEASVALERFGQQPIAVLLTDVVGSNDCDIASDYVYGFAEAPVPLGLCIHTV